MVAQTPSDRPAWHLRTIYQVFRMESLGHLDLCKALSGVVWQGRGRLSEVGNSGT